VFLTTRSTVSAFLLCVYSKYNRKKQSTQITSGELLADKVVRGFHFPLLWLGNFK